MLRDGGRRRHHGGRAGTEHMREARAEALRRLQDERRASGKDGRGDGGGRGQGEPQAEVRVESGAVREVGYDGG